jgi:hypothetical protein
MVQLTTTEHRLINELLECLAIAVDDVDEVDVQFANKTKLQKLLYLAIDEFDIPITYSWYLAGTVVPEDPATPTTLSNAFSEVASADQPSIESEEPEADSFDPDAELSDDPITRDEKVASEHAIPFEDFSIDAVQDFDLTTSTADQPTAPSGASLLDFVENRDSVIDFYRRILPEVWHQQTMRFLQNFYEANVPAEYRTLYLTSIHLRTHLLDAEEAVRAHIKGDDVSRNLDAIGQSIRLDISDFHYQLRSNENLASTVPTVVQGTNVIEEVMFVLQHIEPGELTPAHLGVVQNIQDFVYYHVWRYPCLIISRETAKGPLARELQAEREGRLATFESELENEIEAIRRSLDSVGLLSAADDYPAPPDDDIARQLSTLAEEYLQQ